MAMVSINGDSFFVTDQGSGPPLLLVHGFPLNHTMWIHQIEEFASRHRVLAPDLRGFGKSVVTAGTVTMQQHADDLAAILDKMEINDPIVFCGLSMGGYIAWQFVEKYGGRLAGLILCDTRAIADTEEAREGRIAMAKRVLQEDPEFVAEAMLPKLVARDTSASRPEIARAIREMIVGTAPNGIAAAQRGMAERPDVTQQLSTIKVPTLVIVGEHDEISRAQEMREIADAIPNSRFVEIAGAGHMTPMEQPEALNAAMRKFLQSLAG